MDLTAEPDQPGPHPVTGQGLADYRVGSRERSWCMTMGSRRSVCIESRYKTLREEGRKVGE